jgi:hypothetical protein
VRTAAGETVPAASTSLGDSLFAEQLREGGTVANKDKGGSKSSKKDAQKSLKDKRKAKKQKKAGR